MSINSIVSIVFRYQPAFSCILGGVEAAGLSLVAHRDHVVVPSVKDGNNTLPLDSIARTSEQEEKL